MSEFKEQIESEMAEWFSTLQRNHGNASTPIRPDPPRIESTTQTLVFNSEAEAEKFIRELRSDNANGEPIQ